MKASISVRGGKPTIKLYDVSESEQGLLEHFRPFLPVARLDTPYCTEFEVVGDRLPGTGGEVNSCGPSEEQQGEAATA